MLKTTLIKAAERAGTILKQWEMEIKVALNPKAFDLFVYKGGKGCREAFWSQSGLFAQAKQPAVNKIILASHSVRRSYIYFV